MKRKKSSLIMTDTLTTLNAKVYYIKRNNLDEKMFWEFSKNKKNNDSLIINVSLF